MRWFSLIDRIDSYHAEKRIASQEWHTWFAWYPVKTRSGIVIWLEKVNRINTWKYSTGFYWEYEELI